VLAAGQRGAMIGLAAASGTSRRFFSTLRARTRTAPVAALAPGLPGGPTMDVRLRVNDLAVTRAIYCRGEGRTSGTPLESGYRIAGAGNAIR
jgi:hypothetical protein